MKRTFQILVALLIAQTALAIGLRYDATSGKVDEAAVMLVEVDKKDVNRLTIEESNGEKTVLTKSDDEWTLPDQDNFPADKGKVERLIENLASIKEGYPIATSEGALERFKLTEKTFERRIALAKNDRALATVYLGSSRGAREVYARRDDQNEVYAIDFASYRAPAAGDEWIDANILKMSADKLVEIEVNGLKLGITKPETGDTKGDGENIDAATDGNKDTSSKTGAVWRLVDARPGDVLLTDKAADLASRIADIRIASVLGENAKPHYGLDDPRAVITVRLDSGEATTYRIGKMTNKDDYVLKSTVRPEYFRLGEYGGKQLVAAADVKTLLKKNKGD